jgi:pyridoxamine 5'-phosphate oxidase
MLWRVDETDLDPDPLVQLQAWLDEAREHVPEPAAMTLATVDAEGRPSARVVLLRGLDERGLTFYTSTASRKGQEIRAHPRAALVFHWWELGRQVRVEGAVEEVSGAECEAYWRTRPRGSRLAAWASRQSQPMSCDELAAELQAVAERFAGTDVPRPPFWGGYRVVPESVEFWTHRENRLHDRVRYRRFAGGWRRERLGP